MRKIGRRKKEMIGRGGDLILWPKEEQKKIICHITLVNSTNWIIKSKQRLRFHLGTGEFFGRITPCNYSRISKGLSDNAIIEFETDVTVLMNDKILIRFELLRKTKGIQSKLETAPDSLRIYREPQLK